MGLEIARSNSTAKIVWSCGGSAIEHGVGLGGRADLKPGMVYTKARHGIRPGDEVEPFGCEFMAAKRKFGGRTSRAAVI